MAGANSVTAALATLSAAGWTCTPSSAYTGGPLASPGPIGTSVPSTAAFTALTAAGAVALSPANLNVVISPTGTGVVVVNPASLGTINNCSVGVTTPAVVRAANLQATFTDSSGTPGAVTNNSPRGRVAFAAAASVVVITNSLVTAASMVSAQLRATDGALTLLMSCISAAGSFTITGNAITTGTAAQVDFLVIN